MLHSRLMRYIDEVARAGSIRQAAKRLAVASTAVNRHIIAYEEALGLPIFERLPRGVRLTAAGELLVEHIRATLKDHTRTVNRIGDLRTMRRTKIDIATLEALAGNILAHVVNGWHQSYPFTKINIVSTSTDAIAAAVVKGEAQLGLGFDLAPQPNLTLYSATPCSLGVVVGASHALASRTSLRMSDCSHHAFVLPAEGLTVRALFDRAAKQARLRIEPVIETNSIEIIKRLVLLGDLASVLTRADVELERQDGSLAFIPFQGEGIGSQMLTIVHRTSAQLDAMTIRFAEKLTSFAQSISDRPVQN